MTSAIDATQTGGVIYVLRFSNRVVKVGSSRTPESRLRQHESDAKAFGLRMVNAWLSDQHTGYLKSEQTLISYAANRAGRRLRREYFQDVSFDDLCWTADEIAQSNGTLGMTLEVRGKQLYSLREIAETYPHLDIRAIHWDCVYGAIPTRLVEREYHLTRSVVDGLLTRADVAGPSRSVRHRMERRAA